MAEGKFGTGETKYFFNVRQYKNRHCPPSQKLILLISDHMGFPMLMMHSGIVINVVFSPPLESWTVRSYNKVILCLLFY